VLELDPPNGLGSLGYGLARPHWGKGLATEAAASVIGYGFEVLKLDKVWARTDPRNVASVRVLENSVCGAKASCASIWCAAANAWIACAMDCCATSGQRVGHAEPPPSERVCNGRCDGVTGRPALETRSRSDRRRRTSRTGSTTYMSRANT